jgi:hypothetical protein
MFVLYIIVSLYSFLVARKSEDRVKIHYLTVCVSSAVMGFFVLVQLFDANLPYFTVGCLIANVLIHVFVEEDEKREHEKIALADRQEKLQYSQVASGLASDYEAIYYIDIETGEYSEISASETYKSMDVPVGGKDFYSETREMSCSLYIRTIGISHGVCTTKMSCSTIWRGGGPSPTNTE